VILIATVANSEPARGEVCWSRVLSHLQNHLQSDFFVDGPAARGPVEVFSSRTSAFQLL